MSERCDHCEYEELVHFVETRGVPMSLKEPNPKLPDGWEFHGDSEVIRKCPEHGGEHRVKSSRTLRVWIDYEVAGRCVTCGTRLTLKAMDGQPPKGHDDNIRYQEIVILGVGKCPKCTVVLVGNIPKLT